MSKAAKDNRQRIANEGQMTSSNGNKPIIELHDIVKTYHTVAGKFSALKGVSMRVQPGEFVSIIGKSGSGKTTLVNVLTGIDRPTHGEIIVAGTPIHSLSEGQMATWRGANMGVVFQFFQLLPTLTVLENVILPMDVCNLFSLEERYQRAMNLLELVGLVGQAHKFPNKLSGGQQQRAAIARALANDPPIIATDEPTGNLDSKAADVVIRLFESLVEQGKTILMVTHDDDLAKHAHRTIVLVDGKIAN